MIDFVSGIEKPIYLGYCFFMESVKQSMDRHIGEIKKDVYLLKSGLLIEYEESKGKQKIYVDSEKLKQLFLLSDDIYRTVESLERANKLLYENRGKKSAKKSAASKINGKMGGRPPKEILEAKKRAEELERKMLDKGLSAEERTESERLLSKIWDWEREHYGKAKFEILL